MYTKTNPICQVIYSIVTLSALTIRRFSSILSPLAFKIYEDKNLAILNPIIPSL
jgi:hypothetical protein